MGLYQTLQTLTPKVKTKTLGLSAVRPKSFGLWQNRWASYKLSESGIAPLHHVILYVSWFSSIQPF